MRQAYYASYKHISLLQNLLPDGDENDLEGADILKKSRKLALQ
jgi:hypothetical protein